MIEVEFDPQNHTYKLDGVLLPSVTTALAGAGLLNMDAPWYTEFHRQRGELIHYATELFDLDNLRMDSLDEQYAGFVHAWIEFRKHSKIEVVSIESRVCNPTYGYAGTIDRVVDWGGLRTIIDIKTGQPEHWHPLQTAAYAECVPGVYNRASVYLKEDGKFKVSSHEDINDFNVFTSALAVHNWKRFHGSPNHES